MKSTLSSLVLTASLLAVPALSAMEGAGAKAAPQTSQDTQWKWEDILKEYQVLSKLTEEQKLTILALAQKSVVSDVTGILQQTQKIHKDVEALKEALQKAKETRKARGAKVSRALLTLVWSQSNANISLEEKKWTAEDMHAKLATLSTVTEEQLKAIEDNAPQCSTADITTLIESTEKIDADLGKFIKALETMKKSKEEAKKVPAFKDPGDPQAKKEEDDCVIL